MPRLFVAIDLPEEVKAMLIAFQPEVRPGIRPTSREQMHLTLHFLGEQALDTISDALQNVQATAFTMELNGLGQFGGFRRDWVLWAGVKPTPALSSLHQSIGAALEMTGFQPERRRYEPHITLARCRGRDAKTVAGRFIQQTPPTWPTVTVEEFILYSSVLGPNGAEHCCEARFPLTMS